MWLAPDSPRRERTEDPGWKRSWRPSGAGTWSVAANAGEGGGDGGNEGAGGGEGGDQSKTRVRSGEGGEGRLGRSLLAAADGQFG